MNSAISICVSLKVKQKHIVNSVSGSGGLQIQLISSTPPPPAPMKTFVWIPNIQESLPQPLQDYSPGWKVCLCSTGSNKLLWLFILSKILDLFLHPQLFNPEKVVQILPVASHVKQLPPAWEHMKPSEDEAKPVLFHCNTSGQKTIPRHM